jgi:hypothetical protein
MSYNVRERFHHPDISRNYFYNYGEQIAAADESELEERGLLARFCTHSADAPKPAALPEPPLMTNAVDVAESS